MIKEILLPKGIIKDVILSKFNLSRFPYKLIFALTYNCNSRCKTCNIWKTKSENEMTTKEIKTFFSKNQFKWINLTGGEIFLRKDIDEIFDIILKTQKNLYLFNLTTNASLPEKTYNSLSLFCKRFKGRAVITLSVDSYGKQHDELRGLNNNWKKLIKTYKLLQKIKNISVFFGTTISKYNLNNIPYIYPALKAEIPDLKFNQMHLNLAESSDHYYHKTNLHNSSYESIINYYLKNYSFSLFQIIEKKFLKKLIQFQKTKKYPYKRCSAIKESIFINPYGDVFPCISYNKKLGSLRKENFEKIIKKYKNTNLLKQCPHCWTPCEAYVSILREMPF